MCQLINEAPALGPEAIGKHNMSSVSLVNRCSDCDRNTNAAAASAFRSTNTSCKNLDGDE